MLGAGFFFAQNSTKKASSQFTEENETSPVARTPATTPQQEVSAAAAVAAPTDLNETMETLKNLKKCYDTRDCAFPQNDPREYEIALGETLRPLIRRMGEENSEDLSVRKDVQALARDFLQTGDGSVQDAALDVLSHFPPSEENLDALKSGLRDTPDALLASKSLNEFQRYLGTPMEGSMQAFLAEWVQTGAHFTAQEVAEGILPFINETSYRAYAETLAKIPHSTASAKALAAAMSEYAKLRAGG